MGLGKSCLQMLSKRWVTKSTIFSVKIMKWDGKRMTWKLHTIITQEYSFVTDYKGKTTIQSQELIKGKNG